MYVQFLLFSDVPEEMKKSNHSLWGFNNIVVMGAYKREDMPNLVNLIDLAVVPSLIESYGLVARELKSLGVPTLCTATGGMVDIGNVEVNNTQALVSAILDRLS